MIVLLFSRICELIFTPPVITLLNAGIPPQVSYGFDIRTFKSCDRFVVDGPD
jgi:hypothetical protein